MRAMHVWLTTASLVAMSVSAGPALAQVAQFNIPAQPLRTAIPEFGRQAGVQIMAEAAAVEGQTTAPVQGRYEAADALNRMLRGTALHASSNAGGLFVLVREPPRSAQPAQPALKSRIAAGPEAVVPTPPSPAVQASSGALEEVVVTATRQTSTVNRVPLSIAAATQQALDQQGIRQVSDIQQLVPGLAITNTFGGVQNFTIRGVATSQGAATTGVYLDDVALQKRFVAGPLGPVTSNGSPAPLLFDLERVEVLRGPQGTLYGGSSEGGAIRFITPKPSLTTYSGLVRAAVAVVKDGGASPEAGFAVGGPIVQDKLGFRASIFKRKTAGYVDMIDPYNNGALVAKDANSRSALAGRLSLLWAPTSKLNITAGYYHSETRTEGGPDEWNLPVSGTFTTPAVCFDTRRQFGQTPAPTAAVACPANAVPGQTVGGIYQRPSATFGPFTYLGRNKSLALTKSPLKTQLDVADLDLEYDLGKATLKSITAYLRDRSSSKGYTGSLVELANFQTTLEVPGVRGFPLVGVNPRWYEPGVVGYNRREAFTQELRLSSSSPEARLTWVLGGYYANIRDRAFYYNTRDYAAAMTLPFYGLTVQQVYGVPQVGSGNARYQTLKDTEYAGFGEATFHVTDALSVTAGARISNVSFDYYQTTFGAAGGYNEPTVANGGLTTGSTSAKPFTPKVGAQYNFTPNQLVYVTAAKGFRAGGINTPLVQRLCDPGLATLGLKSTDIPTTFGPDSVWNYEAGGKFRLLDGRLQVNGSLYRIDWKDVQLTVSGIAGCPNSWVQNAGSARSQGFDLDVHARLVKGLTTNFAVSYTDAQYTATVTAAGVNGPGAPLVRAGDQLPAPAWQGNIGLRYDFVLSGEIGAFVRADYFYQGAYLRGPGPGVAQFLPDLYQANATQQVNLRAGIEARGVAIEWFVNNLLDSADGVSRSSTGATATGGGRSGCAIAQGAACTTFTTYNPFITVGTLRPREVGMQVSYKF